MRVARLALGDGSTTYAVRQPDGSYTRLTAPQTPERAQFPANLDSWDDSGESVTGKLLSPIQPTQLLCVGLNYREHALETGASLPDYPILFIKNIGAVCGPETPIQLPRTLRSDEVDYECELAVIIGREARNLTPENALSHVAGYTCANDVSARDWQRGAGGRQWCRGKGFDTFCPLGPELVTADEIPNPQALDISTRLNGQTMQENSTGDMIFSVSEILVYLSASTTLPVGTVILTGTPQGVGMARKPPVWLKPGDEVVVEISGIGTLRNPVIEEPTATACQ